MADEPTTPNDLGTGEDGSPSDKQEGPDPTKTEPSAGSGEDSQETAQETSSSEESSQESADDSQEDAPEGLTEEQEARWKKLQAKHTKRRQAELEEINALRKENDEIKGDAERFRQLKENPAIQKALGISEGEERKPLFPVPEDATDEVKDFYKRLEGGVYAAAKEVSKQTTQEAVKPLYERDAQRQVKNFFEKHPEAEKYRKRMGEINRRTGETLSLDELYYLASAGDREANPSKPTQPDTTGSEGGDAESEATKTFDEIGKAGSGNSVLL